MPIVAIVDSGGARIQEGVAALTQYGGTEVHYEGEDYLIVGARDILAILG